MSTAIEPLLDYLTSKFYKVELSLNLFCKTILELILLKFVWSIMSHTIRIPISI